MESTGLLVIASLFFFRVCFLEFRRGLWKAWSDALDDNGCREKNSRKSLEVKSLKFSLAAIFYPKAAMFAYRSLVNLLPHLSY
jgi:hypothetical protein